MADICLWTKAWRSGAAWVAQSLAQGIAESGGQITFVAPLAEPISREPTHKNVRRVVLPREIVDGRGTKWQSFLFSSRRVIVGWMALLKERCHTSVFLISIPDPLVFTLPLALILRVTGARIILIVHDAVPHTWRFGPRFRFIERSAIFASYKLATTLVALTPQLRSTLEKEFGITPEKISVIPHGPFTLDDVADLPGNGRLLQFGTIRRNKSVVDVIRGVSLARRTDPSVRLVIAGEPHIHEFNYWVECQAAIAEDPDGFEVLSGYVKDNDLSALLSSIDGFTLAYRDFDSQSGVGILAGVNGRPVIATASGGLRELISGGLCAQLITGQVTPDSVASAIVRFRACPIESLRQRSSDGACRLRKQLSWKGIGGEYLKLVR